MGRGFILKALIATAVVGAMATAPAAHATYPGENGKILFERSTGCFDRAMYTIEPDGTDETRISPPGSIDWNGEWSPDGQRIAFMSPTMPGGNCGDPEIWVMNADGTGRTRLTLNSPSGSPTWSPDGSKIAFTRPGPPGPCGERDVHIWMMNVDGSAQTQVTSGGGSISTLQWSPDGEWITLLIAQAIWDPDNDCEVTPLGETAARLHVPSGGGGPIDSGIRQLDWSPDSRKFAGVIGGPSDVYLANAPGGEVYDEYRITATPSVSESGPTWSPDGTKLAWNAGGALVVANADGSGATEIAGAAVSDWQPVHTPSSYIRPKGASPIYASFVTAFEPCTTGNRTHGPPLAHPSCNPPVPESPNLAISAGETQLRSIGSLRMRVVAGVPGGPDDTDVQLSFSLTNVMKASDFSEYSGEVGVRVPSRVTDRESPASSTIQGFSLGWSVPCAPTADPQIASACALNTTLDAVMPGAAAEGTRSIWAFDAIEVHDGGPDGNADSQGDNSRFLTQGVFVP